LITRISHYDDQLSFFSHAFCGFLIHPTLFCFVKNRFGSGPYFVEFEVVSYEKQVDSNSINQEMDMEVATYRYFTVETRPLDQAPLTVYTFLQQMIHELIHKSPLNLVYTADGTDSIFQAQPEPLSNTFVPYRRLPDALMQNRDTESMRGDGPLYYTLGYLGSGPEFDIRPVYQPHPLPVNDDDVDETSEDKFSSFEHYHSSRTIFGRVVVGRNALEELMQMHRQPHSSVTSYIRQALFYPHLSDAANEQYQMVVASEGPMQ
jgi:hypothetical protein